MINLKSVSLVTILLLSVSACAPVPKEFGNDPVKPLTQSEKMMISARNAAIENQYQNIKSGDLARAETAYRTNPKNVSAAMAYAQLLRRVNMAEQADLILKPFAINPLYANEDVLVEYAKLKLQQGDFESAQIFAQEAYTLNQSPKSQMVLGVAVDAQGHHQASENHFRQALEKANMDIDLKNAILNNLALSLIAQNKEAEAQSILSNLSSKTSVMDAGKVNANKTLASRL